MSKEAIVTELEQLGFTSNEANVYVALIQTGPLTATAIAAATGLARTAVYPTLNSLVDQGLVDAGEGYGCKFSAVPAERALPHLMLERERITKQIIERISSLEERAEKVPGELVQVIRSPRAVAERYERLQLEAKTKVEVFVKPPVFVRPDNPVQEHVLGVVSIIKPCMKGLPLRTRRLSPTSPSLSPMERKRACMTASYRISWRSSTRRSF